MDSDAVVLAGISAACFLLKKVRKGKKKVRSMWMCDYLKGRNNCIVNDLELNESFLFKNFTRMSKENFDKLLDIVREKIEKKNTTFRDAVPPEIRLAICLRYLATGDSFASLMYLFKVSKALISSMMPGVLKAIIEGLQDFVKSSSLNLRNELNHKAFKRGKEVAFKNEAYITPSVTFTAAGSR